jgi:predicted nucleic acid-binding protein
VKVFCDSNIVVYALGADDERRGGLASDLLARHAADRTLVLSPQVLMESYNALTRRKRVAPKEARELLEPLAPFATELADGPAALAAMALSAGHLLSPWDALIVQCSVNAGCTVLYSEDLQTGRTFGPVTVMNPFMLSVQSPAPSFGPPVLPSGGGGGSSAASAKRRR